MLTITPFASITIKVSLPKLLYGHNLIPLSPIEIKKALDILNKIFYKILYPTYEKPLNSATISRVDFGLNFKLDCDVDSYLTSLGEKSRYKRVIKYLIDGTLYYRTYSNRKPNTEAKDPSIELMFYDKIKEMLDKADERYGGYPNVRRYLKECNLKQSDNLLR
jgi:hypothetical protein